MIKIINNIYGQINKLDKGKRINYFKSTSRRHDID